MFGIKLSDIHTVYHASNHLFTKPDIDMINKNRVNHQNGMLGLFFSTTQNKWFHGFGKHIYEIEIPKHFRPFVMSLKDFHNLSMKVTDETYKEIREQLLEQGVDYILIEESDDTIAMGVFINLDIEIRLQQ